MFSSSCSISTSQIALASPCLASPRFISPHHKPLRLVPLVPLVPLLFSYSQLPNLILSLNRLESSSLKIVSSEPPHLVSPHLVPWNRLRLAPPRLTSPDSPPPTHPRLTISPFLIRIPKPSNRPLPTRFFMSLAASSPRLFSSHPYSHPNAPRLDSLRLIPHILIFLSSSQHLSFSSQTTSPYLIPNILVSSSSHPRFIPNICILPLFSIRNRLILIRNHPCLVSPRLRFAPPSPHAHSNPPNTPAR